jgi:predicted DNA-binding transcriptional regulator AlpA
MTTPKLITAAHAAELLGISKPTFYQLAEETGGLLKPHKTTGGTSMWLLDNVLQFLAIRDAAEAERRNMLLVKWGSEAADKVG